jgi:hypothetical protein
VVCNSVVQAQLTGEPLSKRLEAAAQHSHLEAQSLQSTAELTGTLGNGDDRLELVKHIRWDTLEQTNALLERRREVEFAIHSALGDFLVVLPSVRRPY